MVSAPRKQPLLGLLIGNPAAYCDTEAMALAEYKRAPLFLPVPHSARCSRNCHGNERSGQRVGVRVGRGVAIGVAQDGSVDSRYAGQFPACREEIQSVALFPSRPSGSRTRPLLILNAVLRDPIPGLREAVPATVKA